MSIKKIVPTAKEAALLKAAERVESFQAGLVFFAFIGFIFGMGYFAHSMGYHEGRREAINQMNDYYVCVAHSDQSVYHINKCWDDNVK